MNDIYIGDGWELDMRPPADRRETFEFSNLLPDARWFWSALRTQHDGGYQGLDEFELTHKSVRWACGYDVEAPKGYFASSVVWRDVSASREDQHSRNAQLASALSETAATLRGINARHANAQIFNVPATPESWADLLAQIAEWVEQPSPGEIKMRWLRMPRS